MNPNIIYPFRNKYWLYTQYIVNELNCEQIANICNCHYGTIHSWLIKFNIPRRIGGWSIMPEEQRLLRSEWAKEHRDILVESSTGKIRTIESRRKQGTSIKGKNHWHWKGGITKYIQNLRNSFQYGVFRELIISRDNYTCQQCPNPNNHRLHLHHRIPISVNILLTFLESNALTLCDNCHDNLHHRISHIRQREIKHEV